jgi:hypothetical protein
VKYGGKRKKKFADRFVMGRGVCASAKEMLEDLFQLSSVKCQFTFIMLRL